METGDEDTLAPGGLQPAGPDALLAGRFQILGLLGTGGMGCVYRARDHALDELVALKMLHPELIASPKVLEGFRDEVRLARKVTHRNVARIFDIGEHGEKKFLTMELIDGEALSVVVHRDGALSLARAAQLLSQVCAGLTAAHAAGIVHRDLKPANILVAADGRAVITDFGIARRGDGDDDASLAGTPAYMAPEQVQGRPVDARTDLYALGATFYELLTGELPFYGSSVSEVALARLTRAPPDPSKRVPGLDPRAARLVQTLMAVEPARRFASAAQVAAALAELPSTSSAPQPGSTPRPASPMLFTTPSAPQRRETTVAVLPFRNTGDPADEYLADGLTDELIDSLSMTPGLRARSRGAVMRYKGTDRDPRDLGRELDVQVVVDGSVGKRGQALRVIARVASVADGFQIWAHRFERPAPDLLAIAEEASRAIADALSAKEAPSPLGHDPAAADLYLRARFELHKFTLTAMLTAVELFERAVALAPNDPAILSGWSQALRLTANLDAEGTRPWLDLAEAAGLRAVAVDPSRAEPHLALARLASIRCEWPKAARLFHEVFSRRQELADAHEALGGILLEVGERDAGDRHLRRAVTLDSQLYQVHRQLAFGAALDGDDAGAEAAAAALRGRGTLDEIIHARLALWRGDRAAAQALLDRPAHDGDGLPRALARACCGHPATPGDVAYFERGAQTGTPRRRAFLWQLRAEIAGAARQVEAGLDAVAAADRYGLIDINWLDRCPALKSVRDDPRFGAARAPVARRAEDLRTLLRGA